MIACKTENAPSYSANGKTMYKNILYDLADRVEHQGVCIFDDDLADVTKRIIENHCRLEAEAWCEKTFGGGNDMA
jgi:hypothetical protein